MMKTCLVTGGAGFIGCALSESLAQRYRRVVAVDVLHPQVHAQRSRPERLHLGTELIVQDVCDREMWDTLLLTIDTPFDVIHLAAETGTAQSLELSVRHAQTNVVGTAQMLDAFTRRNQVPEHIILTSSRAVYGEGAWQKVDGLVFYPGQRTDGQLRAGLWDFPNAHYLPCRADQTNCTPASVYGATKLAQENILAAWAGARNTALTILRLQNVYGPGQSLSNPYTGILPLFARIAKTGEAIPLYEDGQILRDFVHIEDTARAILLALSLASSGSRVYDVGTGVQSTIADVAKIISARYNAPEPFVCGKYRNGDVRHAACDISLTRDKLGYTPEKTIEQGLAGLLKWIEDQLTER